MTDKRISAERNVAVIFNLSPQVRVALQKSVKAGDRSKFVSDLIAEKLGVSAPQCAMCLKGKSILSRLFKK